MFAGKSGNIVQAKRDVLWNVPKSELNQLVHVHLYRQGAICRRQGYLEQIEERIDELLDRMTWE